MSTPLFHLVVTEKVFSLYGLRPVFTSNLLTIPLSVCTTKPLWFFLR